MATGVPGLDEVLAGGLPAGRMYLVAGDPGAGKTTLGLQFLLEGRDRGEACLYITLSETAAELRSSAASHGWSLDGIEILDLQSGQGTGRADAHYTILHPAEVELGDTMRTIVERIEELRPRRVCFDSLSEVRLLSRESLRFRREVLALKQALAPSGATVLLVDYRTRESRDIHIESLVHGIFELEHHTIEFGSERRRISVRKLRGSEFRGGHHDYRIRKGGIAVFPRIIAAESRNDYTPQAFPSGIAGLDELLGGGVGTGTSTMLLGPSGVGKSTLASTWALAAAERGERAVVYLFDEGPSTWVSRLRSLGLDPHRHLDSGRIVLSPVDPAEMSPGQFASLVQEQAVSHRARVVLIDSINGYLNAMPAAEFLGLHLHELLQMLNHHEVVTLLVLAQHGILGQGVRSPIELSYLADAVVLLRYFEAFGEVGKALSVVKKRHGPHERAIRELRLSTAGGIDVGGQLTAFQGVLAGSLVFSGGWHEREERVDREEHDGA
ncbi:ATPase domain-containing protein [Vulgatibacter sp.]|uniref:ATPase domain-containing protein n=1 Tax=Vulgatibacter sp. TaxID=1971226 RepID=UPI003567AA6D